MTLEKKYFEQLQTSAVSLRLQIPESISNAVVDKINLAHDRSDHVLPESIIYAKSIDQNRFHSETHLARVRLSGWQLEIVKVIKKSTDEEFAIVIINRIGSINTRKAAADRMNGNNQIRYKAMRKQYI